LAITATHRGPNVRARQFSTGWLTLSLAGHSDSSVRVAGGYVQMADVAVGLAIAAAHRGVVRSAPDRTGGWVAMRL